MNYPKIETFLPMNKWYFLREKYLLNNTYEENPALEV